MHRRRNDHITQCVTMVATGSGGAVTGPPVFGGGTTGPIGSYIAGGPLGGAQFALIIGLGGLAWADIVYCIAECDYSDGPQPEPPCGLFDPLCPHM